MTKAFHLNMLILTGQGYGNECGCRNIFVVLFETFKTAETLFSSDLSLNTILCRRPEYSFIGLVLYTDMHLYRQRHAFPNLNFPEVNHFKDDR